MHSSRRRPDLLPARAARTRLRRAALSPRQVTVEDCHNCTVLLGPVDGSVMLRGCTKVEVWVVCRQFRTRDCRDCTARLFTPAPIVESSSEMRFAPWNAGYAG